MILLSVLVVCGIFRMLILFNRLDVSEVEKKVAYIEQQKKEKELKIEMSKLEAENLRVDVEKIRLQAFMNAYSKGRYIVEVEEVGQ